MLGLMSRGQARARPFGGRPLGDGQRHQREPIELTMSIRTDEAGRATEATLLAGLLAGMPAAAATWNAAGRRCGRSAGSRNLRRGRLEVVVPGGRGGGAFRERSGTRGAVPEFRPRTGPK